MRERAPLSSTTCHGLSHYISIDRLEMSTYHRVSVLCQSSHGKQTVVRVDDDICRLHVREDGVCLDQLLREAVIHSFQEVTPQARSCTTGNRV